MSQHARLSPSNHQWPHCPGSVRENAQYPGKPSPASLSGTGSHFLLELCIRDAINSLEPWDATRFSGQTIGAGHKDHPQGWAIDNDRIARVNQCLVYIKNRVDVLKKTYPTHTHITVEPESRSNPGAFYGRDDWWGTCDVTILVHQDKAILFVEVIDYKDGFVYVDINNNTQLISYAFGKTAWLSPETAVMITLVQPKTSEPVRYQQQTAFSIKQAAEKLSRAATLTDAADAPLIVGKHCELWCDHKTNCVAYQQNSQQQITHIDSNSLIAKAHVGVEQLSNEELAEILEAEKSCLSAFSKVKTETQRRIVELDQTIPGWVMGQGNRKQRWLLDDDALEKKLRGMKMPKTAVYQMKLVSPSQALKYDKFSERQIENLQEFIETTPGKPVLKQGKESPAVDELFSEQNILEISQTLSIDPATPAHVVNGEPAPVTHPTTKEDAQPPEKITQMTEKAEGHPLQSYLDGGWTQEKLIEHGFMVMVYPDWYTDSQQPPPSQETIESFI